MMAEGSEQSVMAANEAPVATIIDSLFMVGETLVGQGQGRCVGRCCLGFGFSFACRSFLSFPLFLFSVRSFFSFFSLCSSGTTVLRNCDIKSEQVSEKEAEALVRSE